MQIDLNQLNQALTPLSPALAAQWDELIKKSEKENKHILDYIFLSNLIPEAILKPKIAEFFGCQIAPELPANTLKLTTKFLPLNFAKTKRIAILEFDTKLVKILTSRPEDLEAISNVKKKLHKEIEVYYCFDTELELALKDRQINFDEQIEKLQTNALSDLQSLESLQNSSKLLDTIFLSSLQNGASDIHIEPHEETLLIRFRVDGELKDMAELPIALSEVIASRIKVLADLRIDEHQKPQDGRFKLELSDGSEITTRVSILPVYQGEKIVMRILLDKQQKIDLSDLGYTSENQNRIYQNCEKAHGMMLVTGPTGSGKTTTLYTLLKLLNKADVNLMTIEDPIEYRLKRVNQIQVNVTAGLTFASGLRSILRQDPDVVMVGEIRDEETANIAVNAALTGHLVLATLHTNSAIDTLPRLVEMGVEPYLVAATLNLIVAQRLVRKLCDNCKQPKTYNLKDLGLDPNESQFNQEFLSSAQKMLGETFTLYVPQGCNKCGNIGYSGRLAIAEALEIEDKIKTQLFKNASPLEIEATAKTNGFKTLMDDAIQKIASGMTSYEEIIRVIKN
jgi:type IV pilus assembly protein PilB